MTIKNYVITLFVSTTISGACAEDPRPSSPMTSPGREEEDPAPALGPRHDSHGISYAALKGADYQDAVSQGIVSSWASLPSGVIFYVISSPDIVPKEQAEEVQLVNARRGAAARGQIIEDSDAPPRPFLIGDVEGTRIIYRVPAGGVVHTEVFVFETARRTVTVFIELTDPPDLHEDVVNTLTRSLRVEMPQR